MNWLFISFQEAIRGICKIRVDGLHLTRGTVLHFLQIYEVLFHGRPSRNKQM